MYYHNTCNFLDVAQSVINMISWRSKIQRVMLILLYKGLGYSQTGSWHKDNAIEPYNCAVNVMNAYTVKVED